MGNMKSVERMVKLNIDEIESTFSRDLIWKYVGGLDKRIINKLQRDTFFRHWEETGLISASILKAIVITVYLRLKRDYKIKVTDENIVTAIILDDDEVLLKTIKDYLNIARHILDFKKNLRFTKEIVKILTSVSHTRTYKIFKAISRMVDDNKVFDGMTKDDIYRLYGFGGTYEFSDVFCNHANELQDKGKMDDLLFVESKLKKISKTNIILLMAERSLL